MDRGRVDELRRQVRDVLWELDPAGVSDDPDWPRSEYDTYVDRAVSALVNRGIEFAAVVLADSIGDRMGIELAVETIEARLSRIDAELYR